MVIENEEDDTDVPEEDASAETDEAEDSQEEPEKEEVTVTIYSSNANADGFVTETVNTTDLTAQWLLDQLSAREVIPADVQALSCEVTEADGIKSLNLDLNQALPHLCSHLEQQVNISRWVASATHSSTLTDASRSRSRLREAFSQQVIQNIPDIWEGLNRIMKKAGYYSSGEFARMAQVTLRTIRYYDKQNILKPSYVTDAGARFYTDEDFARLQQILLLKYLGFSLDDIREMTIAE